ncbi:hypothetical protein [Hyphomicrobium sp.]|uniref:hypothetical protein n=1 Tax=Hyphomicrobium sp. TaxID=82 RepID=UPI001DDC2855|nr:hypothetical protein [Hyphomicrobium sp.]MBY0559856.1 hypothetical protein [Hyphomicrobium sp.]
MAKDVDRFRVIRGGEPTPKLHAVNIKTGRTEQWESYRCHPCSDDLGFSFTQLHEVRIGAFVTTARGEAGKLTGGQHWLACPRCFRLVFMLRDASPANEDADGQPADQEFPSGSGDGREEG